MKIYTQTQSSFFSCGSGNFTQPLAKRQTFFAATAAGEKAGFCFNFLEA